MPVEFTLNVLEQADGSARLRMAGNDILVAVHGPSPVKTKQELTDRATLQVSVETMNTPPSINETSLAYQLEQLLGKLILLQLHPRSLISIVVQPIKLGSSPYASIVNACMAALIDSGIPLRSTIIAVSGRMKTDKITVNSEEIDAESRPFMFMFDGHKEDNTPFCFEMYHPLSKEKMNEVASVAKASSKELFDSLKSAIKQRLGLRQ